MSHTDHASELTLPTSQPNGALMNRPGTSSSSGAVVNGHTAINNVNQALEQQKETVTTGGVSGIVPTLQ